jgi:hypothetical protein
VKPRFQHSKRLDHVSSKEQHFFSTRQNKIFLRWYSCRQSQMSNTPTIPSAKWVP